MNAGNILSSYAEGFPNIPLFPFDNQSVQVLPPKDFPAEAIRAFPWSNSKFSTRIPPLPLLLIVIVFITGNDPAKVDERSQNTTEHDTEKGPAEKRHRK